MLSTQLREMPNMIDQPQSRLGGFLLKALLVLGLFGAALPAVADAPQAAAFDAATAKLETQLPLDPAVRSGKLDNGLTYFIRKNAEPEKRAELRLAVNAGSLLENADQRGLAHFLEHMAFNGTRDLPKHELVDYLQRIGMRFGADLNARTGFEETVYKLTVPTDDPALLEKGLVILENWADGLALDADEVDKEKGVVVEEWRLGRGAIQRTFDQILPQLFKGSLYADRLPIGSRESIESASREKLMSFYRDWYRPDQIAVVAVGDFDLATIEGKIKTIFGKIPKREGKPVSAVTVPGHAETLVVLVQDPELPITQVSINFKHPAPSEGAVGDYRLGLVKALYHAMFNARLAEITQGANPPWIGAESGEGKFVRPIVIYSLDAVVRNGESMKGLEALMVEFERVDRHGFTATELERAKVALLRGFEQGVREKDKTPSMAYAEEYTRHFLNHEPAPGIEREAAIAKRFVPEITLDEINKLGQKWITPENRVVVAAGPAKADASLPTREDVMALLERGSRTEVAAYVDQVTDEPLVAKEPVPGAVVSEQTVAEIGVTEWKLKNGVRVVLKPTDFKNDEIRLQAFSPGGSSVVSDADFPSAVLAVQALAQGGLGNFSPPALEKKLTGKVVQVRPFIGELDEGLQAVGSPQDLETLLQLVYLHFTAPRLDAEAFKTFYDRTAAFLANRSNQPGMVFQDSLAKAMWNNHLRKQPPSLELLEKVSAERVLASYRDRFSDASDFTFLFVGNFDPAKIKPLIERWIGGLPGKGRQESFKDLGLRFPAKPETFKFKKGLEPKSVVQVLYGGEAPYSREQVYQLESLADALQIHLVDLIREQMGAAYGVAVHGNLDPEPVPSYQIVTWLACAPDEVDQILKTIRTEIDKWRKVGPDPALIEKVKVTQRRERELNLRENRFWTDALETYYSTGMDPRLILKHEELIGSLSVESVKAAANRYFVDQRSVVGVLDPEKAPEPETKK
jgi:zinc protease